MTGMVSLWGGPSRPPCILNSLSERWAQSSGRIAIVDESTRVTYAELAAWTTQIARALTDCGIVPGDRVAVTGNRGAKTVAAFLAVLHIGATYVPLDPGYPSKRLGYMLDDSEAKVLMHGDDPPDIDTAVRKIMIPPRASGARVTADPGLRPEHCDPALPTYLIYTSGSTGVPKGVAIPHSCLDNMAHWQCGHSPRKDLCTAQFAPLNFDVYFQEVLGTLCGGGTLMVMPERLRRDPFRLLKWIRERRVERLFLPYVALNMLSLAASQRPTLADLALVEVNTAGEQVICTPPIREFFTRAEGCRLTNHYGQSESAMVSAYVLPRDPATWPLLPPIGTPLPGCEIMVDPADPSCPEEGELLVAGLPLSTGYVGRPDLTAERYIRIPRTPHGHTRAFRTGDLVRIEGGVMHFLTRADHEIKVRGVRVNPLEVESLLTAHSSVASAACVAVEGISGSRSLHAAVTAVGTGPAVDTGALSAALGEFLPAVAVPSSITVLEDMPKTASGKIDRAAVARLIAARR